MAKILKSEYALSDDHLTPDQIRTALSGDLEGFKYFFNNCCQLQDKETRQMIHPVLNKGQELIASTLLKYISKKTRTDYHRECIILAPRQIGKSTLITEISNYMMAYVPGCERINLVHTLQTGAAAGKYFNQKISPIVTGVHPDIMPTIEKNTLGTSSMLTYKDIKGIPRNGIYEVTSAGSNSVRSSTVTVWLADEPGEYRAPEMVEDAISGAIGDYGFSFTAYIGTFTDRISSYFLDKIKAAINNPDDMELVFIPWFLVYGRKGDERGVDMSVLSEYESKTIIPEMIKYNIPSSEFACKIGWYRRRALRTAKIRYEFPTSVDDIMALTSDKKVFSEEAIARQRNNIEAGVPYRFVTDSITRKVEAQKTDESPFRIFRTPVFGHKYKVVVDPITATNEDTDYFAMCVFDDSNLEQVAVFIGKEYSVEEYADFAVSIAKIYNNAVICPESNVADAFLVACRGLGYYYYYYESALARKKKEPGVRTTASSKEGMVDKLSLALTTNKIILHDEETIDELGWFEKKVKKDSTGKQVSVKMAARGKKHDDLVACFTGDTLVATEFGHKSIKDIRVGDMVLTSKGLRAVEAISARRGKVLTKFGISATPDHKFITEAGELSWRDVGIHDIMYLCPSTKELANLLSNTKASSTGDILNLREGRTGCITSTTGLGKRRQSISTEKSMKTTMVQSQRDTMFTIKTATQRITLQRTSKLCQEAGTCRLRLTVCGGTKNGPRKEDRITLLLSIQRKSRKLKRREKRANMFANYAAKSFCRGITLETSGGVANAADIVTQIGMGSISINGGRWRSSAKLKSRTKIQELTDDALVYNLTVNDVHEYYANGILVSNCCWIYVSTLDDRQLNGKKSGFAFL